MDWNSLYSRKTRAKYVYGIQALQCGRMGQKGGIYGVLTPAKTWVPTLTRSGWGRLVVDAQLGADLSWAYYLANKSKIKNQSNQNSHLFNNPQGSQFRKLARPPL